MSGIRCFTGVRLPAESVAPLVDACHAIRELGGDWRNEKWVAPENLHLTLKFLGAIEECDIESLAAALGRLAADSTPFELLFAGIDAVPDARRCRMLWASFTDPEGRCAALAAGIERAALDFGVAADKRPVAPHVTLCRARRSRPLSEGALMAARQAAQASPPMMSVPSASLFSSRLTPRGPIYSEIGAWPLGGVSPRRAESARGAAG